MTDELPPSRWQKFLKLLEEDTSGVHPRLMALSLAAGLLPTHRAARSRARLFALAGFRIGEGTLLADVPKINGHERLFSNLVIGSNCRIDAGCVLDLAERITIGDRVTVSPGVMVLTSTHEIAFPEHRAGLTLLMPVTIGDGAWLGARSIILPGVTVGAGAIVDASAVVNRDVAPHTRVGGIPATVIETRTPAEVAAR